MLLVLKPAPDAVAEMFPGGTERRYVPSAAVVAEALPEVTLIPAIAAQFDCLRTLPLMPPIPLLGKLLWWITVNWLMESVMLWLRNGENVLTEMVLLAG